METVANGFLAKFPTGHSYQSLDHLCTFTMKKLHVALVGLVSGITPSVAADKAAAMDVRLATMKAQLSINTAQEAAWQAFASAAKQQSMTMRVIRAQTQRPPTTVPERMSQGTTAMQQRETRMVPVSNAFNALYSVVTPEQKAIADQGFGTRGGRAMGFEARAG